MMDPYAVLGLAPGADPDVVRAAYRALAKKHHPDAGGSRDRFMEISNAYQAIVSGGATPRAAEPPKPQQRQAPQEKPREQKKAEPLSREERMASYSFGDLVAYWGWAIFLTVVVSIFLIAGVAGIYQKVAGR